MELLSSILIVLIAITLHEAWGHKLFAVNISGLKPTLIAIGIPITKEWKGFKINTVFYTWKRAGKIPVVFSWLLVGGGVGFDDKEYYSVGKYWQKVVMILAGPMVNFAISFGLLSLFVGPSLSLEIVKSYALVTLEILKSIFSSQSMQQAVESNQFFELTQRMSQLTLYWQFLAYFVIWNISLCITNLMPIPGLDGGQIVGTTIINLVGEKAIKPVKLMTAIFSYFLVFVSTIAMVWWFGITIYNEIFSFFV